MDFYIFVHTVHYLILHLFFNVRGYHIPHSIDLITYAYQEPRGVWLATGFSGVWPSPVQAGFDPCA